MIALAKNAKAARAWTRNMEAHRVRKEYIAIVRGVVSPVEGVIDAPIGHQGGDIRVRQWVNVPGAVPAVTAYKVADAGKSHSVVRAFPKTGRLHQIRVHFAAIGHPLLGDPLYTGQGEIYQKMVAGQCTEADRATLGFPRVALHAAALTFPHPVSKKELRIAAPLPEDMKSLIPAISDKLMLR